MYVKDRKRYQSLKLTCGSDVPFTLVLLRTMLKTQSFDTLEEVQSSAIGSLSGKKRQQHYSEVFEQLSVKGAQRKLFYKVWTIVVGWLSVLEESQHQG